MANRGTRPSASGVLHRALTEGVERLTAEFRSAFVAEPDAGVAEVEADPAGGLDVGVEAVAAGRGDDPWVFGAR
jgi:hypothetical protein